MKTTAPNVPKRELETKGAFCIIGDRGYKITYLRSIQVELHTG